MWYCKYGKAINQLTDQTNERLAVEVIYKLDVFSYLKDACLKEEDRYTVNLGEICLEDPIEKGDEWRREWKALWL